MTLQDLKVALDKIVADGRCDVVIETDVPMSDDETDTLELKIFNVEKIGGRIVISAEE